MNAGPPPFEVLHRPTAVAGDADLTQVRARFDDLAVSPGSSLLVGRCQPTAAFSRRDLLLPGIGAARAAAVRHGFVPAVRHVGGHLAAYDEGSLVLHLWSAHPEPTRDLERRFAVLSGALAEALRELGAPDVRVGAVPGEYCDGTWSVNAGGSAKLAGTGQRISKHGWMWSAVLTVARPEPLRAALRDCYGQLGLELDPATVGCLDDQAPGVTWDDAAQAVGAALTRTVERHQLLPRPSLEASLVQVAG